MKTKNIDKAFLFIEICGENYKIPLDIIAESRAKYFYIKDNTSFEMSLQFEGNHLLDNPDEAIDWADNNMNWLDIKEFAIKVPSPAKEKNYDQEWTNCKKSVIFV